MAGSGFPALCIAKHYSQPSTKDCSMEDNSPVNARSKPRPRIDNVSFLASATPFIGGRTLMRNRPVSPARLVRSNAMATASYAPDALNVGLIVSTSRDELVDQARAREKSPQVTNGKHSPPPVGTQPPQLHSSPDQPSTAPSDPCQPTERTGLIRVPELSRLPRSTHLQLLTRAGNSGLFPMKTFIPLHAQADLVGLAVSTAEEIGDTYPLFTPGYVKALTDQVVHTSQANPVYEPTLWAVSSALVAIAMQWKAENSSLAQLSPMMWSHFKNAFSMLPYLITKGPGVLSFHALVLMAVFLHGCAETRLVAHLITSAVRVAQMAGIPIRNQGHDIPAELNLRAFWTIYALDVEISNRLTIMSVIDHHHLPLEVPSHHPPEPMTGSTVKQTRILDFQAGLATIRSKIHYQYILSIGQTRALASEIESLDRFDQQLDLWAQSLPPDFRPSGIDQIMPKQLSPSVILLHYQYYHSKSIMCSLRSVSQDGNPEHSTHLPHDVSSARATIRLLGAIPLGQEQFFFIWRMLLHPLSMVLLLFYDVLRDPKSPGAESSVLAIEEFVDYLKRIIQELGCDVHRMLEGCTKMRRVARSAILPNHYLPVTHTSSNLDPTVLFERLRQVLSSRKNYLSLAQRLMSDMPGSEDDMLMGLTKALAIDWDRNDAYGPFVPNILKADSYNFGFEFMV
ncbi:hypothetical protein EDB81DRAFT_913927 [Dactylonectria macrodidyma]|uniref:Xylanolytic transcriptional activator regulatory domain-containing protein n=1 Tax=Dactylonectria macrodidyma TaxID=307937 RepID=A0A9P9DLW2_9HYPO|nr:hypothetical protein EDB81DRAFT_913927 [Dactylonectria macrodidyma]